MLNNNAIDTLIKQYEKQLFPADWYIGKNNISLNICYSIKNLACQANFSKSQNASSFKYAIHSLYCTNLKINYDEYNMNDGKPYNNRSIILEEVIH